MAYLINLMHIFYFSEFFDLEAIFSFIHHSLLEKHLNFWVFLSVPHLLDNYVKIVDEWGRNLMCNHTLPSLFVILYISSLRVWVGQHTPKFYRVRLL